MGPYTALSPAPGLLLGAIYPDLLSQKAGISVESFGDASLKPRPGFRSVPYIYILKC